MANVFENNDKKPEKIIGSDFDGEMMLTIPKGDEGIFLALEVLQQHGMTEQQARQVIRDMKARGVMMTYNKHLEEIYKPAGRQIER